MKYVNTQVWALREPKFFFYEKKKSHCSKSDARCNLFKSVEGKEVGYMGCLVWDSTQVQSVRGANNFYLRGNPLNAYKHIY